MRRLAALLIAVPLIGASAPVPNVTKLIDAELKQARAEARAADAQVRKLEQAASKSRDEASRLRAQQAAAAEAIAAAEARISVATAEGRLIAASLAAQRQRLQEQQRPVSSLLAGLAMMAQHPPLLALAGGGNTDEMVRVRILLDSGLPAIRRRSALLSSQLATTERLERAGAASRAVFLQSRQELARKRDQFARLEAAALQSAERSGTAAIGAGDVAIASGEEAERIAGEAQGLRSASQVAAELAALGPVPPSPIQPNGNTAPIGFAYRLPADAPVVDGLGEISASGVRSRGLTLATRRGARVFVPASGIVRFSGPFRDYDGIAIIDHGGGWMSLIVNVASEIRPGTRVRAGEPLGRAMGPLGVELSRNGQHLSPALIAGSSATLSNGTKGG